MRWIAALAVLGIVAAAIGALLGLQVVETTQLAAGAQKKIAGERPVPVQYSGSARLLKLAPVITNLAKPSSSWARVEASLIFNEVRQDETGVIAAQIGQDIVAYMRTMSLPQLEGARGLQYLREDLNERANLRSSGKVKELIIETLVVQ
jgi:flagellar FliL protein